MYLLFPAVLVSEAGRSRFVELGEISHDHDEITDTAARA